MSILVKYNIPTVKFQLKNQCFGGFNSFSFVWHFFTYIYLFWQLRQENEELRKQIKNYKSQLNDVTQDCSALNNRLEIFDAHNTYLKSEINKLLLKYGDESNEHIQDMLKTPEITDQNTYTCMYTLMVPLYVLFIVFVD